MSLPDSAEYWWDVKGYTRCYDGTHNKKSSYKHVRQPKRCPICGRRPKIYNNKTYFRIICKEVYGKHIDHEVSVYGDTLEQAMDNWDRRYTPSDAPCQ